MASAAKACTVLQEVSATSTLPPSQLSKAISRISTEYRLQFAWPKKQQLANGESQAPIPAAGAPAGTTGPPRKSLSMGALKQGMAPSGPAPVHKKRPGDFDHKRDGTRSSISPGINHIAISETADRETASRLSVLSRIRCNLVISRYDDVRMVSIRWYLSSWCISGIQASELEPLVGGTGTDTIDGAVPEADERDEDLSDFKITFRSDSGQPD